MKAQVYLSENDEKGELIKEIDFGYLLTGNQLRINLDALEIIEEKQYLIEIKLNIPKNE